MITINAGIKRVVCERRYHADKDTFELFKKADVELVMSKSKNMTTDEWFLPAFS